MLDLVRTERPTPARAAPAPVGSAARALRIAVTLSVLIVPVASRATDEPGQPDRPVLLAMESSHLLHEIAPQALPPPPQIVKLETGYFGTVTLDHRAHLARKISCKECHGPGPVRPIEWTPRLAHDRCVGCHRVAERGPTDCRTCHVSPPETRLASAAASPGAAKVAEAGAKPVVESAASAARPAAGADPLAASDESRHLLRTAVGRTVGVGLGAGVALGPSLYLSSRSESVVIEHGIDRLAGSADVRTFVLIGGGGERSLRRDLKLLVLGMAGVDAVERPLGGIMPSVGGRVGIEWAAPPGWFVQCFRLAVTAQYDVANRRSLGRDIGGAHVYATLGTGFRLPAR